MVARIEAFSGIGAETVYLQVLDLDDLAHLELLAREVLPRVAAAAGLTNPTVTAPRSAASAPSVRWRCTGR